MKKSKNLSWIPLIGTFFIDSAHFTKNVYIFCRIYQFFCMFGIGYFLGKVFL